MVPLTAASCWTASGGGGIFSDVVAGLAVSALYIYIFFELALVFRYSDTHTHTHTQSRLRNYYIKKSLLNFFLLFFLLLCVSNQSYTSYTILPND